MTTRTERRFTIALYAIAATYLALLIGLSVTRAAEPIQFKNGKPPDSLSVGQIIAEASINGAKYKACKGDIFSLFQGNLDKRLLQVGKDLITDALASYKAQMATFLICRLEASLNHTCIYGNCKGGGADCVSPKGSDVTSYLKKNWQNKLKSSFLANCTALYSLKFTGDTVDDAIKSQGFGGAPAFATDWIINSTVQPDERGWFRFWTILVNTDVCPYMKNDVYRYFHVPKEYATSPPAIDPSGFRVDAGDPLTLTGKCTLPKDFNPTKPLTVKQVEANGGFALFQKIQERQNNFQGFISLAAVELQKQRSASVGAASEQLVAGGGYSSTYASSSCSGDPNGKCIDSGSIALPPGAVRDERMADVTANYNKMLQPDGENFLAQTDLSSRLQVRLLGLMNKPLPIKLELSDDQNPDNFTPAPTPTPAVDPNDPACTGGPETGCTCIAGDTQAQGIAAVQVADAISRTMQTNPELFVAGTNQIVPGQETMVLSAICDRIDKSICVPSTAAGDQIVIRDALGVTLSFDVITADGSVSTTGGTPVRSCPAGVQD